MRLRLYLPSCTDRAKEINETVGRARRHLAGARHLYASSTYVDMLRCPITNTL